MICIDFYLKSICLESFTEILSPVTPQASSSTPLRICTVPSLMPWSQFQGLSREMQYSGIQICYIRELYYGVRIHCDLWALSFRGISRSSYKRNEKYYETFDMMTEHWSSILVPVSNVTTLPTTLTRYYTSPWVPNAPSTASTWSGWGTTSDLGSPRQISTTSPRTSSITKAGLNGRTYQRRERSWWEQSEEKRGERYFFSL